MIDRVTGASRWRPGGVDRGTPRRVVVQTVTLVEDLYLQVYEKVSSRSLSVRGLISDCVLCRKVGPVSCEEVPFLSPSVLILVSK